MLRKIDSMNRIAVFFIVLSTVLVACGEAPHEHDHDHEHEATAVVAEVVKPGLIHNVYFWLREDISEEEKASFMAGARSLGDIESVQAFYMGPHADTEAREVVDHSYDLSLVIHFADKAAQDAYQVDPIHTAFVESSATAWSEVKVYDVAIE